MSKLRSDSAWAGLSAEQRETLEGWLFEENLGYKEALERAQKEFGITVSLTSLADYYRRLAQERMWRELRGIKSMVGGVDQAKVDFGELETTAMKLVANRMIQLAVESPGKVREMVSLGRILVANEAQAIKRERFEWERKREEEDEADWLRVMEETRKKMGLGRRNAKPTAQRPQEREASESGGATK
jgi:hypothetical protein